MIEVEVIPDEDPRCGHQIHVHSMQFATAEY